MDWLEIEIGTTTEGVEPVTGLILEAGIPGAVVDDPKDLARFLRGPHGRRWDYVEESLLAEPERETRVRAYVADNAQGRLQWEALRAALAALKGMDAEGLYGRLGWQVRGVKDEDWANNWKAYFKPFPVGDKLVVKPSWETWGGGDGRIVLEIDPGSSFGTGQHETTRLCLEMLEGIVSPGIRMLDVGCGSGILMTAGLLLGAAHATGVDVEENAMAVAAENMGTNGLDKGRYALHLGDLTEDAGLRETLAAGHGGFDLAVANIVAGVILGMAPFFSGLLAPGGLLLLSGIIDDRRGEVAGRMAQEGFVMEREASAGEWHALLFRKM